MDREKSRRTGARRSAEVRRLRRARRGSQGRAMRRPPSRHRALLTRSGGTRDDECGGVVPPSPSSRRASARVRARDRRSRRVGERRGQRRSRPSAMGGPRPAMRRARRRASPARESQVGGVNATLCRRRRCCHCRGRDMVAVSCRRTPVMVRAGERAIEVDAQNVSMGASRRRRRHAAGRLTAVAHTLGLGGAPAG